eukprot:80326-Prorocentrum_minimum.AAC.2
MLRATGRTLRPKVWMLRATGWTLQGAEAEARRALVERDREAERVASMAKELEALAKTLREERLAVDIDRRTAAREQVEIRAPHGR